MLIFHLRAGKNIVPKLHLHPFPLPVPYSVLKACVFVATGEQWHSAGRRKRRGGERRGQPFESGAMRGLDLHLLALGSRTLGMPGHVGVTTTILHSRDSWHPAMFSPAMLCAALPCGPSLPVG